ncbi:hypothetical protein [Streptomyces sp. NPDC053427]|uniref:hypothetical protein n=1 Tax=Streptomyces sp. NPDC053427 TaxID=3365701 RepID=UPI0037D930A0
MSDSEFAAQVANKLKSIAEEMDELQKLKTKLEDLQQHLGTEPREEAVTPQLSEADIEPAKSAAVPATVPAARRAKASAPKVKPAKKTPAKAAGSAKKPRKAAAVRGTARQKKSTRADSLLGLLNDQPRTVAELTKLLAQEFPHHAAPETAVRNSLENSLVAKGLAHRGKQGRNVFYSHPAAAPEGDIQAHEPEAADVNEDVVPATA